MKKLLSLLSILTISGTAAPTTIAASSYEKKINNIFNSLETNNLKVLNRNKRVSQYSYQQYPTYPNSSQQEKQKSTYRTIFIAPELERGYPNVGRQRNNIRFMGIGTDLGDFVGVPDSEAILVRLFAHNNLEPDLRRYLQVSIRNPYAYINVDESSVRYEGSISLRFNVVRSSAEYAQRQYDQNNWPEFPNRRRIYHGSDIAHNQYDNYVTLNNNNTIGNLGTIRGNLRSGITDAIIIRRFFAVNNQLPRELENNMTVEWTPMLYGGSRANRIILNRTILNRIIYDGSININYIVHDEL